MRSLVGTLVWVGLLASAPIVAGRRPGREDARPVRYYIIVRANLYVPQGTVSVFGASNLPAGSVLAIFVSDFLGEGSKILNDEVDVKVGANGLFETEVPAKANMEFRANMVCDVTFIPNDPRQPANVVRVVGRHGEHLGTSAENPEIDGNSRVRTLVATTVVEG